MILSSTLTSISSGLYWDVSTLTSNFSGSSLIVMTWLSSFLNIPNCSILLLNMFGIIHFLGIITSLSKNELLSTRFFCSDCKLAMASALHSLKDFTIFLDSSLNPDLHLSTWLDLASDIQSSKDLLPLVASSMVVREVR